MFVAVLCSTTEALAPPNSRRGLLQNAFAGVATVGLLADEASASLLDDYGTDPSKIQQKEATRAVAVSTGKSDSVIEPNLRSNYYYPTNKKRYLPRIKKCNDAIPGAAESIGANDWVAAKEFAEKVADDTILPLKLYTSSLTGGGTNVKVSYTKTMFQDADNFEKNQKLLVKAIGKQDQELASTALEGMATALQEYRVTANLTGPDGGGDIPSVDEIRRAACRVQGRTFEKKVLARDARLRDGSVVAQGSASDK